MAAVRVVTAGWTRREGQQVGAAVWGTGSKALLHRTGSCPGSRDRRHGKECKSKTLCVYQTHSLSLAKVGRALEIITAFVLLSRLFRTTVLKVWSGSRPQRFLPGGPCSSLLSPLSTVREASCRQTPSRLSPLLRLASPCTRALCQHMRQAACGEAP